MCVCQRIVNKEQEQEPQILLDMARSRPITHTNTQPLSTRRIIFISFCKLMHRFCLVISRFAVYGQRFIGRTVDLRRSYWLFRSIIVQFGCVLIGRSLKPDYESV